MPGIARDAVASDHLVYAFPFPIGPEEHEVTCAEDELVVMCPAWNVGDRLGPGRHRWRTHDPSRPVAAYFVLTAPVEVSFDVMTNFMIPTTGQPVRLRAAGSLQVRCLDPALLIAQFVGLPFDSVNDGVMRSVARSIERMLARLLTRRVVMAGAPAAVTDPAMLPSIVEELVAYNPTAGAVFGVELARIGHLAIMADDGSRPWQQMTANVDYSGGHMRVPPPNGDHHHHQQGYQQRSETPSSMLETARGGMRADAKTLPPPIGGGAAQAPQRNTPTSLPPPPIPSLPKGPDGRPVAASGEIGSSKKTGEISPTASGEIGPKSGEINPSAKAGEISSATSATSSGEISSKPQPRGLLAKSAKPTALGVAPLPKELTAQGTPMPSPGGPEGIDPLSSHTPVPRRAGSMEVPLSDAAPPSAASGEIGGKKAESGGALKAEASGEIGAAKKATTSVSSGGMASGEIGQKIPPGGRVLVPGPNGLMQSATVRQLLQGYYELEVGGSGETIWVPMNGVVPE